jgi:nitrite reductase/ring-hydroxylating ferredoxin subunit
MTNDKTKYKEVFIEGKKYFLLCPSNEIFEGKGKRFHFGNEFEMQIAVFRYKGELFAVYNICPHRHIDRIYDGIIKDGYVMCPEHGWTYSLSTGENKFQKQGRKGLKKFEVFEKNGFVYIEEPVFEIPKWKTLPISE